MSLVKQTIKDEILNVLQTTVDKNDPDGQADSLDNFADKLADVIINAIKSAKVSVPGTGLIGYNSTQITGTAETGSLS